MILQNTSKFHILCSCLCCRRELIVQNLDRHVESRSDPPNACKQCSTPTRSAFCSHSCSATYNNQRRTFKPGPKKQDKPPKSIRLEDKPRRGRAPQPKEKTSCVICGTLHLGSGTCSKQCKSILLSRKVRARIDAGFNPNNNRGRGRRSYLEISFSNWLSTNFPQLIVETEKPFKNQSTGRTYFVDFYFPTLMIGVELDGSQHTLTRDQDAERDAYIQHTYNIPITRITHREYRSRERVEEITSLLSESNRQPLNGNQLFYH
jgi:very-short-patch-repair endonuclease/predicted nucleic acid-binding Zn ribbon protein